MYSRNLKQWLGKGGFNNKERDTNELPNVTDSLCLMPHVAHVQKNTENIKFGIQKIINRNDEET